MCYRIQWYVKNKEGVLINIHILQVTFFVILFLEMCWVKNEYDWNTSADTQNHKHVECFLICVKHFQSNKKSTLQCLHTSCFTSIVTLSLIELLNIENKAIFKLFKILKRTICCDFLTWLVYFCNNAVNSISMAVLVCCACVK